MTLQHRSVSSLHGSPLGRYLDILGQLERLHRLLLDVIKDDFERLGQIDLNPVQALLLFNIGDHEVTAGELKSRGYYQGSNVSYNLKKLVDLGYMHYQRCPVDRRAVRIRLTPRGQDVRGQLLDLFQRHAAMLERETGIDLHALDQMTRSLRRIERFWGEQIRYIY